MPDFIVSTAFKASQDQISPALKQMGASAGIFGTKTQSAFAKAAKGASLFKSTLAANLISRGISNFTMLARRGAETVIEAYVEMDDTIGSAAAKFPEKIKRGTVAFQELEDAARDQAKVTKYTAAETASALEFMAKAGFSAKQSMALLPGQLQLATAANLDLARSSDIATDALGAFNLMSKDEKILAENMALINDVFAKTMTTANVDMEDLYETMKDGGPVMTSAGQDLETFAALAGKMGSAGIKGSKAGTTLKNMMLQLIAPTKEAKDKLKELNIGIENEYGQMRDIIDILEDYTTATNGMGSVQRDATTDLIFGKRAIAGVNVLLMEGTDSLRDYRDVLLGAKGAAGEMAAEIEQSLGNKIKKLQSAAIELGMKFIDAFKEDGKTGIEALTDAVSELDMKPIIAGAKEIFEKLKWLFKLLRDNWENIKGFASALIKIKIAMTGLSMVSSFAGVIKGFGAMTTAANTAAAAAGGAGKAAGGIGAPVAGAGVGAKVGAAGAGLGIGLAIGDILSESVFQPLFIQGEKTATYIDNLTNRIDDRLSGFGGKGFQDPKEIAIEMQLLKKAMENADQPLYSLESAIGGVTALFTDAKSPQQEFFDRITKMNEQMMALAAAMAQAKAQIARDQAQLVNVKVENNVSAPPGSNVDSSISANGSAPKVNSSQAGKS